MRARVSPKAFEAAVRKQFQGSPKRSTLPVLSELRLEAKGDSLTVQMTDLDYYSSITIEADVAEPGVVLAPAKGLLAAAKTLKKDLMLDILSRTDERPGLELEAGTMEYSFFGQPSDEWPAAYKHKGKGKPKLLGAYPAEQFAEWAKRVQPFASTEDSRPILQGIHVCRKDGFLYLTATNGHRLINYADTEAGEPFEMILTQATLIHGARLFGKKGIVRLERHDKSPWVRLVHDSGAWIQARLLEGPYPNWEQLLPRGGFKAVYTLNREEMLAACEKLLPLASDLTHRSRWAFNGDGVRAEVKTPDKGEAKIRLEASSRVSGKLPEVGFNLTYLKQIMKALDMSETVTISLKGVEKCAIFEPDDGPEYRVLLMPLRLLD